MLVPERGDPTTKIGLFRLRCMQALRIIRLLARSQVLSALGWPMAELPFAFIGFYFGCTLRLMNPINIGPGGEFSLGGENFVIEGDVLPKDRRPSTSESLRL